MKIFLKMITVHSYHRLVSAYEDKVLGLSENGEIFEGVKNKTFPEFVDHVLNEWKSHQCNGHWAPQYMHCNYCDIRYDIIGRVENLENDFKYIAMKNNFTSDLVFLNIDLHVHPSGTKRFVKPPENVSRNSNSNEKIEKTKKYFMLLNTSQLDGLYRMYQIDFEMFGYSAEPYHSVADSRA